MGELQLGLWEAKKSRSPSFRLCHPLTLPQSPGLLHGSKGTQAYPRHWNIRFGKAG